MVGSSGDGIMVGRRIGDVTARSVRVWRVVGFGFEAAVVGGTVRMTVAVATEARDTGTVDAPQQAGVQVRAHDGLGSGLTRRGIRPSGRSGVATGRVTTKGRGSSAHRCVGRCRAKARARAKGERRDERR